ncbi:hypothetical protein BDB00DRAFT_126957 [Zychaea mexicana]|uniref:uncharacterized protein n=1 Tax=Zychaea mexicana TaxID=64656 RepID=UPI0022FEF9EF|nr:uncharacterized protein BDB00DRAFT_126957 [Zychaea mexicana]KAI9484613.1 hypothetical protein BDB00DRAFT_126957 [Zychaea mexicana]
MGKISKREKENAREKKWANFYCHRALQRIQRPTRERHGKPSNLDLDCCFMPCVCLCVLRVYLRVCVRVCVWKCTTPPPSFSGPCGNNRMTPTPPTPIVATTTTVISQSSIVEPTGPTEANQVALTHSSHRRHHGRTFSTHAPESPEINKKPPDLFFPPSNIIHKETPTKPCAAPTRTGPVACEKAVGFLSLLLIKPCKKMHTIINVACIKKYMVPCPGIIPVYWR